MRAQGLPRLVTVPPRDLRGWEARLPPPPPAVGNYVPGLVAGSLAYTSGVIPLVEGKLAVKGKVGREVTVEAAYQAARQCALNALSILNALLGGLDRIERVVQVLGFVASAEGFTEQARVMNGATDLLVEIFGEGGRPSRVAVGVAELPLGAPVELSLVVERRA